MDLYHELKKFGHVKTNESMAKHTTFKIGGPADFFITVDEAEKLVNLLRYLDGDGVSYMILGGGSNMLVRDEGYRGVVVKVHSSEFTVHRDKNVLEADAGCSTVQMAQESIKAGLTGFEWGVGVPGTIGGAVRGNAGAMGGEMKDVVEKVEVYQDGEVTEVTNTECQFGYRDSMFKHTPGVVLRVWLSLAPAPDMSGMKRAMEHLQYRMKTQPQGHASTGCIFKNVEIKEQAFVPSSGRGGTRNKEQFKVPIPDEFLQKGKISAGWLVEQAGMKGAKVGNALVSPRHGNFVVNTGGATAAEVLTLVEQIKERVYDTSGIEIEEEIQIV